MSARGGHAAFATALLAATSVALGGCVFAPPQPEPEPIDIAAQIERDVAAFLVGGDDAGRVRAILIYHDGEPVLERYTGADAEDYWDTRSVTTSVMSALIGIAIGQGLISGVDATLGELLPSFAADMTPEVGAITLEQLLTQTENFPADRAAAETFWSSPDWVRSILAQRAAAGPGDGEFRPSNAGPHLLSAVLVEATGRSVLDFARDHFFEPLAIKTEPAADIVLGASEGDDGPDVARQYNAAGFTWPVDPQGFNTGAAFLQLRPRDLAAIGLAYLAGGRSPQGAQVIPEAWVEASTTTRVTADGLVGYGYLWWTEAADGSPAYFAAGRGGQLIEVVPDRDLVVVVAAEYDELDPGRDLKAVSTGALVEVVSTWIAPHFVAD